VSRHAERIRRNSVTDSYAGPPKPSRFVVKSCQVGATSPLHSKPLPREANRRRKLALTPGYDSHRRFHVVSVSNRFMIRRLTVAAVAVSLAAGGLLFLYAHLLNKRAERLLQNVYELSQQQSFPSLADIQQQFGKELKPVDGCSDSECTYTVLLSNRVLAAVRITSYTEIKSYFWVKHGLVRTTMVDYTTTVDRRHSVVSHVQIDFCSGCQVFAIDPWDDSSSLDANGIVEIGKEASAQNIRMVLSLNTRCMTKFGGCETVADLLPTIWQRTPNKKIACTIQNDRGFVVKPANWP
jgi:hypothetical protein